MRKRTSIMAWLAAGVVAGALLGAYLLSPLPHAAHHATRNDATQQDTRWVLSWQPSPGATGYKVHWSAKLKQPGPTRVVDVGAVTRIDLACIGLKRPALYRLAVSAYDAHNTSPLSRPVTFVLGPRTRMAPCRH